MTASRWIAFGETDTSAHRPTDTPASDCAAPRDEHGGEKKRLGRQDFIRRGALPHHAKRHRRERECTGTLNTYVPRRSRGDDGICQFPPPGSWARMAEAPPQEDPRRRPRRTRSFPR